MNKKSLLFVALAAVLSLSACGGGDEADEDQPSVTEPSPTDGSQSKSELAGYGRSCVVLGSGAGTALSGKAFTRYIELDADGTYFYQAQITEGTGCTYGSASGGAYGTINTQFTATGTYTVGGTNTTPSTSTKVTFTPLTHQFQIKNPQTLAAANAIAVWANTRCSGNGWNGGFSTTADSFSNDFDPSVCVGNTSVEIDAPPALNSASQYNIFYRTGGKYQTGAISSIWSVSAGSFPGSYGINWN